MWETKANICWAEKNSSEKYDANIKIISFSSFYELDVGSSHHKTLIAMRVAEAL